MVLKRREKAAGSALANPKDVKTKGEERDDCCYVAAECFNRLHFLLLHQLPDGIKNKAEAQVQEKQCRCLSCSALKQHGQARLTEMCAKFQ